MKDSSIVRVLSAAFTFTLFTCNLMNGMQGSIAAHELAYVAGISDTQSATSAVTPASSPKKSQDAQKLRDFEVLLGVPSKPVGEGDPIVVSPETSPATGVKSPRKVIRKKKIQQLDAAACYAELERLINAVVTTRQDKPLKNLKAYLQTLIEHDCVLEVGVAMETAMERVSIDNPQSSYYRDIHSLLSWYQEKVTKPEMQKACAKEIRREKREELKRLLDDLASDDEGLSPRKARSLAGTLDQAAQDK